MRIVWLQRARQEYDHQIRHISFRNPIAALEQDRLISKSLDRLSRFPESGRGGRLRSTRELVIPRTPFIAIYRIHSDRGEIHVLRILHSAQKWPPE